MDLKEFEYEQNHLTKTYNKLNEVIKEKYKETKLPDDLKAGSANNPDEVPFILQEQERFLISTDYLLREIQFLESILPEVYFSRLDLTDKEGNKTEYYISKTGMLLLNTVDWRSDIGALYYNVTNTKYDGAKVSLKRKFDLSHSKLNNYYDSFFSKDGNEDYTDGFLLEVLRNKKNEPTISNIIKTIQNEQNLIIRSTKNSNIVVIGCAGSGKTMILLHRLSFLKFYSKNMDFSRVKIITPNSLFKDSFESLQRDLELYDVKMLTIADYYKSVLKEMGYLDYELKEISEYSLSDKLLSSIYSDQIFSSLFTAFKNFINNLFEILDKQYFVCKNLDYKQYKTTINSKYETILNALDGIKYEHSSCKQSIERKISDLFIESSRYIAPISSISEVLKLSKNASLYIDDSCIKTLQMVRTFRSSQHLDALLEMNFSPLKLLDKYYKYLEDDKLRKAELNKVINEFNSYNGIVTKLEYELNKNSKEIKKQEDALNVLQNNIRELKFYNIFKKARINKEILEVTDLSKSLIKKQNVIYKKLNDNKILIDDCKSKIERLNNEIESTNNEFSIIKSIEDDLKKLSDLEITLIEMNELFDKNNSLAKIVSDIDDISNLRKWFDKYFVIKVINPLLKKEGAQLITKDFKYSFYYMYLLYLISTYKKVFIRKNQLICIDEFQDLSKLEIDLVKELNDNATLNLYGDFNQRTLSKGTKSEDEFKSTYEIYHLKNNYRNTNQITSFYNDRLNMSDNIVGVDGPDVIELKLDELSITENLDNCVLICSSLDLSIFEKYKSKIQVFKVEETKGLEFNTVYVYDKNMNSNERYVAYSRALYQLFIITN